MKSINNSFPEFRATLYIYSCTNQNLFYKYYYENNGKKYFNKSNKRKCFWNNEMNKLTSKVNDFNIYFMMTSHIKTE